MANPFKEKEKLSPLDSMKFHPELYWSTCLKLFNYQQARNTVTVGARFASNADLVKFNGCRWNDYSINNLSVN